MAVQIVWANEGTAKLRRVYLLLVDDADGKTPELGETGGQPTWGVNGAGLVNTTNTLVTIGNGNYFVELTPAEISEHGRGIIHYDSGNVRDFNDIIFLSIINPYDPKYGQLFQLMDDIRFEFARLKQRADMQPPTIPSSSD